MLKSELSGSSATVGLNIAQKDNLTCSALIKRPRYLTSLGGVLRFIESKSPAQVLLLFSLLAASVAFTDNSNASPTLSFSEAYQLARENNPEIAMASYQVDVVQA